MRTEQAIGEFYEKNARDVWTYAYRVTGNAADADDIVQEAFLRLFRTERLPDDDEELRRAPIEIAAGATAAVLLLLWAVPGAFAWLPRLTF